MAPSRHAAGRNSSDTSNAKRRIPKLRRHKTGQGFVQVDGHQYYLGRFDLPETKQKYHRLIAEWIAAGYQMPVAPGDLTVVELCNAFWQHAKAYYRKPDGTPTGEIGNFRQVIRPLTMLYGDTKASDFGPLALKAVRQWMIDHWCRAFINRQVCRVKRIFKWGCEQEMIRPDVYHGLLSVSGLKRGRSEARESEPVEPASDAVVNQTLPFMTPTLRAMVQLQRATGMRPGEVTIVRGCDLDTNGKVWVFRPTTHKTEHHGHNREVYIGPGAQPIIEPFLQRDLGAFLFSPAQSEAERLAARHANRKTSLTCGNRPGTNRASKRKRPLRDHYNTDTYGQAVRYACERAFPHPTLSKIPKSKLTAEQKKQLKAWHDDHRWTPNQLRHTFATVTRRELGLDIVQVLLGHANADISQVYAEVDRARAIEAAGRLG